MKFSLVFENSGDALPFEVKYNHQLLEFFIDHANKQSQNSFSNDGLLYRDLDKKLTHLHWATSKTNEVLYDLIGKTFKQNTDLENYLDQHFLNQQHSDWVFSQYNDVNIDNLRFSSNPLQAQLGNKLHELYPDDIRVIKTAPALEKLGYIFPFEEVNMAVHRLENSFVNIEFKADEKWKVFNNPYIDNITSNRDIVNFSFGYTYVGRQYYNKFKMFDTKLEFPDHYNYEMLELAFQINLSRPETVPFSQEALIWAQSHNIKLIAEQLPIANVINLEDNLFKYRKILYRNSRDNNRVTIKLH
jgi:hypothetical protein